ncbi:MAG: hypothetical protein J0M04_21460 [Verrucomicrobia bacterium]|nr:hypothetical protein [Verrucomicrobiota bacterium]
MLRIPAAGEPTPALVEERPEEPQAEETDGEDAAEGGSLRRRRVRKRRGDSGKSGSGPSWERDGKSPRRSSSRREGRSMRWILIGGGLAFLLLVGGVILALREGRTDDTITSGSTPQPPPENPGGTGETVGFDPAAKSESETLEAAAPLAKTFLEAKSIPELARLVRNPDVAAARMKEWYPGGKVEPLGMAAFNTSGSVEHGEVAVMIDVQTADRATKVMNFVWTADGLRIDWESWVGWSETPWPGFLADRPAQPKLFRVIVKAVDYYNFTFTDDRKWRSLRLESLDGETSVYGYVERDTLLDSKIRVDPDAKQSPMILRLKFPEGAAEGSNQVLITDWVADGWVEPNNPAT